jgi:WD40 repeat protein
MRKDQLRFSPDGRYLSVGVMPHVLLDTTGGPIGSIGENSAYQWSHCFVRGGTACAYVASMYEVRVHDLRTRHEEGREFRHLEFRPRAIAAGPGGAPIYVAGWVDYPLDRIELWEFDAVTLKTRSKFGRHTARGDRLAASADGTRLAAGGDRIRVWNIADGKRPARATVTVKPRGHSQSFELTDDGKRLAIADSYALSLWDTRTGERVAHSGQHRRRVTTVACHPLRPVIATGDSGGFVFLWEAPSAKPEGFGACRVIRRFEWGLGEVVGLAFAADGLRCAAIDAKGKVVVWDLDV